MAKYLISATEVVNQGVVRGTPANARFDTLKIAPHIKDGINRFVKPALAAGNGTHIFFNAMVAARENSSDCNYNTVLGSVVTAFEDESFEILWVNHLFDLAALAVYHAALPFIAVQTTNTGVMQMQSQFGENIGVSGVKFLQNETVRAIDLRIKEMREWLCDNRASYPDFDARHYCGDADGCDCESDDTGDIDPQFLVLY